MTDTAVATLCPPAPAKAAPELRPARRTDAEGIHTLLTGALRDTFADRRRWEARWAWQCWDNPYRQDRPAGWVLIEGGRLIGHLGVVYVPLRVDGQRRLGAIVSAYCVAPDAAARGGVLLGLQLAETYFDSAQATGCLPLATSANDKTGAVFARFGCKPAAWTREFYRVPVNLPAEIRACWGGRSRLLRRLQTGPLAGAFKKFAPRVYETLKRRPAIPLSLGCHLEESADIAEWTPLLGRLDEQCSAGTLSIERSAEYLDWRYARHPEREGIRLLVVRHRPGTILGAAIVFLDQRPDQRLAVIEDLIAPAARPDIVKALLCAALRFASDGRAGHLVSMAGRWNDRPLYWELGFETRARSAPAAVLPKEIPGEKFELGHGAMF